MALYRLFLPISAIWLSFSGCTADSGELFAYRDFPASFTAVFPSPTGDVFCAAEMGGTPNSNNSSEVNNASVTFTVKRPERSAGIVITCSAESCTVTADGTVIPVSADASRALRDVFLILTSETEGDVPTRSSEGDKTTVEFAVGSLTLDENLLPCAVECTDMNGETWCVKIENYTLINTED